MSGVAAAAVGSASKVAQSDRPLRVLLWGTYDLGKPRTRIIRDGLRDVGAQVIEIHADIWRGHEDKSQLGKAAAILTIVRAALIYPVLVLRYLLAPKHDVILVPYLGQVDILILWPFARLRGKKIALDLFLSITDTVIHDRRLVSPKSLIARSIRAIEKLACSAADRVILDTPSHAAYVKDLLALSDEAMAAIPVGTEGNAFPRLSKTEPDGDGSARILFYGQLIPLHGIETILAAALSERGRRYRWHLIGTGQMRQTVEDTLANANATHVRWDRWVPYTELNQAIEGADICLGIFGDSRKAASVVPNKVYQALCAGRSVITRRSPAMLETFADDPGLALVQHSDPDAVLDAIDQLSRAGFPTVAESKLRIARPTEIADCLCREILYPLSRGRASPC